jgi:hypothetical protein
MKSRAWAIVALVVAVSAAATGTSSADSSAILADTVQIQVTGRHTGPQPSPGRHRIAHGRFALSGALSDRGIFEDYRHAIALAFVCCSARRGRSRSRSSVRVRTGESRKGRSRTPGFAAAEEARAAFARSLRDHDDRKGLAVGACRLACASGRTSRF